MIKEHFDTVLLNWYAQYAFLKSSGKNSVADAKLLILKDLMGQEDLSSLSEKLHISKEELIEYYKEGEKETSKNHKHVASLIITTEGFANITMRYIRSAKNNTVDLSMVRDYLQMFARVNNEKFITPSAGVKQDACSMLLTYIVSTLPIAKEAKKEDKAGLLSNIIKNYTSSAKEEEERGNAYNRRRVEDLGLLDTSRFFYIVDKFDNLQSVLNTNNSGKVIVRSLIDVLAYLLDETISREQEYLLYNEHGNIEARNIAGIEKYVSNRLDNAVGKTVTPLSTNYIYMLPFGIQEQSMLNKENIDIAADFSAFDSKGKQDISEKKQTYHRLVDIMLTRSCTNFLDFSYFLAEDSNTLTESVNRAGSNSNSPIFKHSTGYVDTPDVGTDEFENLSKTFGSRPFEHIFKDTSGCYRHAILNDSCYLQLMEMADICSIIKDMSRQLMERNLSWYHLKPLYKEYKDNSIRTNFQYESIQRAYRSYYLNKYQPDSIVSKDFLGRIVKNANKYASVSLNSIEAEDKVQSFINFLDRPSKTTAEKILNMPIAMVKDYTGYRQALVDLMMVINGKDFNADVTSLINIFIDLQDARTGLVNYLNRSRKLVDEGLTYKTYLYLYAANYDKQVERLKSKVDQFRRGSKISVTKEFSTGDHQMICNVFNEIMKRFVFPLKYCLQVSSMIEPGSYRHRNMSIAQEIEECLTSDIAKQRLDLMRRMHPFLSMTVTRDTNYNVDVYGLYRSKGTNELIVEEVGFNSEGKTRYKIKNELNYDIVAIQIMEGKWIIE